MAFDLPVQGKITQNFGDRPEYYAQFGQLGSSYKYLSYFDLLNPIVIPVRGVALAGILNTFTISPSTNARHIKKSIPIFSLLRLKTHTPDCLAWSIGLPRLKLLFQSSQTFRSIFSPFHIKSTGVLRDRLGRFAPKLFMNHSSQAIPVLGLPSRIDSLGRLFLRYQERLLHKFEQYFTRLDDSLSIGINILQSLHFISSNSIREML